MGDHTQVHGSTALHLYINVNNAISSILEDLYVHGSSMGEVSTLHAWLLLLPILPSFRKSKVNDDL